PLITTKSGCSLSRSPGISSSTTRRPVLPTTSPMKSSFMRVNMPAAPSTVPRVSGPAIAPADALLEAHDISKSFGDRQALRGVSLSASPGEIVAIIGPNGAGKTTLLSIIAGIQKPDAGTLNLPSGEIGWVPQQAALYGKLTVAEN